MHHQAHRHDPGALDDVGAVAGELAGRAVDPVAEWRWTPGDTGRVVVAGLTVVIGGIAASRGVPSWERATFLKVNGMPDALYPLLWGPMQLGNVWVGTGAAALLAALVRRRRAVLVLLATPVTAWMVAKAVKAAVGRGRPDALGLDVQVRGEAETGLGYVSGHALVAFALAGAAAAHLRPGQRRAVLAVAAVVGLARVYVGVHLPLDVVGGAAGGLLVGEAARVVELRGRRGDRPVGPGPAAGSSAP